VHDHEQAWQYDAFRRDNAFGSCSPLTWLALILPIVVSSIEALGGNGCPDSPNLRIDKIQNRADGFQTEQSLISPQLEREYLWSGVTVIAPRWIRRWKALVIVASSALVWKNSKV
jgi:hypothetical protein